MSKQVDYIIVGQGIAGTVLGLTFIRNGKSVCILDQPNLSNCSKVAAGNFNPIVFKRVVKSWMADELIPFADEFYRNCESLLNQEFYWKKEIVKLFTEENEKEFWIKKASLPEFEKYLSPVIENSFFPDVISDNLGAAFVKDAANLFVVKFLDDCRNYFLNNNQYQVHQFIHQDLILHTDSVQYQDLIASKIIFCDGYLVQNNPFFNWIPLKPAKGEVITVKIKNLPTDKIINKGVYMLPIGDDLFIVGTTYDWENLNDHPSEKAKTEIADKLTKVLKVPFEIVDHQAGVRPSVSDRRPVVGLHPQHPGVGIFNGMGTKGVMLAPYFAKEFFEYLTYNSPLNKEVDLKRFVK